MIFNNNLASHRTHRSILTSYKFYSTKFTYQYQYKVILFLYIYFPNYYLSFNPILYHFLTLLLFLPILFRSERVQLKSTVNITEFSPMLFTLIDTIFNRRLPQKPHRRFPEFVLKTCQSFLRIQLTPFQ